MMTDQEKQKLNEELAKWAGFFRIGRYWAYPEEVANGGEANILPPNFTDSFDACLKWLMPKLFQGGLFISLVIDKRFSRATILSGIFDRKDKVEAVGENKEPALAFCLAVEKLIVDGGV